MDDTAQLFWLCCGVAAIPLVLGVLLTVIQWIRDHTHVRAVVRIVFWPLLIASAVAFAYQLTVGSMPAEVTLASFAGCVTLGGTLFMVHGDDHTVGVKS